MNRRILCLAAALVLATNASAQEQAMYPAPAKPLTAEYTIYSGELGDEQAPTKEERKLAVEVTGQAAKDLFDSIYPDAKGVKCSEQKGERLRRKGRLWCAYSPSGGYRCFFGFNLRTGELISGGSC
jgi:hypothetical protein